MIFSFPRPLALLTGYEKLCLYKLHNITLQVGYGYVTILLQFLLHVIAV